MSGRAALWTGLCIAILALGGFGGYVAYRKLVLLDDLAEAEAKLPALMARAEEAGFPFEAADLEPNPSVQPADNAAPSIQRLDGLLAAHRRAVADIESSMRKADWPSMKTGFASARRLFDEAEFAATFPRIDFNRDWDMGVRMAFREYAAVKRTGTHLLARSLLRAREGNVEGALEDLAVVRRLAVLLEQDGPLIGNLVGIGMRNSAAEHAKRLADAWSESPRDLERLDEAFNELPPPSLLTALRCESYFVVTTCRNEAGRIDLAIGATPASPLPLGLGATPSLPTGPRQRTGLPKTREGRAMLARGLETWIPVFEAAKQQPGNTAVLVKAAEESTLALEQKKGLSYKVVSILMPVLSEAANAHILVVARERVAESYIHILRRRAQSGKMPASLAEAGLMATDPFDGKPLKFRRNGAGFVVWSVGSNGVDDGGKSAEEVAGRSSALDSRLGDVCGRFPNPAPASAPGSYRVGTVPF